MTVVAAAIIASRDESVRVYGEGHQCVWTRVDQESAFTKPVSDEETICGRSADMCCCWRRLFLLFLFAAGAGLSRLLRSSSVAAMVPAVLDVLQKPLLILPLVLSCPYSAFASSGSPMWDFTRCWSDDHVLIFYTVIYCHYAEHTDKLQLGDLLGSSLASSSLQSYSDVDVQLCSCVHSCCVVVLYICVCL
jgi:hypothetical protein